MHALPAAAQREDLFQGAEREAVQEEIERLAEIQARHRGATFGIPGVHGMGIGADRATRELRFGVAVDDQEQAVLVPTEIERANVVTTVEARQEPIDGGASCTIANPCHANQLSLPVEMGNSRGPESLVLPDSELCDTCTLGFKVCSYGTHYYVTAGHCSRGNDGCPATAPFGADTYHVGAFDANPQCTITQDMEEVGTVAAHAYAACGAQDGRWDAALIKSSDVLTSWSIRDIGTPGTSPAWVLPEDAVHKSGRTTGHTFGIVHFLGRFDGCAGTATRVQDVIDAFGLCGLNCDQELQDCLAGCPQPGGCGWCQIVYQACCRTAALTPNC